MRWKGHNMDNYAEGRLGEVRAEQYLAELGYEILARNYKSAGSEIDLIARDGSVIVFVEVKTRMVTRAATGREAVTAAKQRRIVAAALRYLQESSTPLQ